MSLTNCKSAQKSVLPDTKEIVLTIECNGSEPVVVKSDDGNVPILNLIYV